MKISDFRNWDADEMLDMLGLEKKTGARDWLLPSVGLFAIGVLFGVGVGMLFAPKEGRKLREDLQHRVGEALHDAKEMVGERMGASHDAAPQSAAASRSKPNHTANS